MRAYVSMSRVDIFRREFLYRCKWVQWSGIWLVHCHGHIAHMAQIMKLARFEFFFPFFLFSFFSFFLYSFCLIFFEIFHSSSILFSSCCFFFVWCFIFIFNFHHVEILGSRSVHSPSSIYATELIIFWAAPILIDFRWYYITDADSIEGCNCWPTFSCAFPSLDALSFYDILYHLPAEFVVQPRRCC